MRRASCSPGTATRSASWSSTSTSNGFLYVQPIGGWDMQILLGQYLTVWTKDGPITGVVARRAIHLLKPDERNKVPEFTDVWVDIGAKDKEEARDRSSAAATR